MSKIKLTNVRLSYPNLFRKAKFNGEETKYEATFLLDKDEHADVIEQLKQAIKDKIKEDLKGQKVGADRICLKDGDNSEYEEYHGHYTIKASSNKRPTVVDRDTSPLTEDDNKIYAGCYVNAFIQLWMQNNNFGKRINCNLLGVQFAADGDPFGDGGTKVTAEDFDVIEGDDDDFDDTPF